MADEADRVDPVMREALAAAGWRRSPSAREYGGRFPRVDSLAVTVVREALAGVSAHLDSLFAMQGIGSYAAVRRRQRRGARAVAARRRRRSTPSPPSP